MGTAQVLNDSMAARKTLREHWEDAEFRAIFLEHYARVVAILVPLLGDRSNAEELANDAFYRLYRQPALQFDGNVGGWLYRTATHLGIDALRAAARRQQYETAAGNTQDGLAANGPLEDLLQQEKSRRVRAVLASIKTTPAQLLILRTYGFSYKELAEALDLKANGIGTMLNRAEEEFRKAYLELYPNEGEI